MTATDTAHENDESGPKNPLAKLGQALKPTNIAARLHRSGDDEDGPRPNGTSASEGKAHQRTEEKKAEKAEKKAHMEEEKKRVEHRRALSDAEARQVEPPEMQERYGELEELGEEVLGIEDVVQLAAGQYVTFRARLHAQRDVSSKLDFLLLRYRGLVLQGVLGQGCSEHMIKWVQRLPDESIVQVGGTLQEPPKPITSNTDTPLEVKVDRCHLVEASHGIPFSLMRGHRPPQRTRLNNRVLDLRHPTNQAIFKLRSRVLKTFRETLDDLGFLEINTPKLQPAATESGAEVFRVKYFGRQAFLAQSPQLMKQMAISADFDRVYEIGPVFRAENSNTHRHLTEYTGLDIEMAIQQEYHEIFHVLDTVLKNIFVALSAMRPELERVLEYFPSDEFVWLDQTPVIPFHDAILMLRADGRDVEEADLHTPDEIRLGELVKEKYGADFFVLDKFPLEARPFYTMSEDGKVSNSFDMFIRGQEVCTGGQRINDPEALRASMREAGIDEHSMEEYLSAFDWGVNAHGGAGLGLERIVAFFLNLPDVRLATLFHRDPQSFPDRPPSLPHQEADTLQLNHPEHPPSVEDLIANYGDATNTSWLDDRFDIWRDADTGAAVGYSRQNKFCMITGDPLCDETQKRYVAERFLRYVEKELRLRPVWMMVSEELQDILAGDYGWRTLSCTQEQRSDSDQAAPEVVQGSKEKKGAFKVREVKPEEVKQEADKRIEEWKAARNTAGKQIHLTEIAPWRDEGHRRYFIAESTHDAGEASSSSSSTSSSGKQSNGHTASEATPTIDTLVVLTRLAPSKGYQLKWALDFPSSPHGAIEATVQAALSAVPGEPVTFGTAVSEHFVVKHGIKDMRARFMERTYRGIVKSLSLDKKAGFREKFGVTGDLTYICYPKGGVKPHEWGEIVKFFE
ncbi:aspartate-tRNA(Asn) ligase [Cryptococcus sp. DSM 104549]